uniref:Uncharacterized protein n=1 Tax=Anopheles atroparvus TaxID=41427 RepID=A0A182J5N1_ANOAO
MVMVILVMLAMWLMLLLLLLLVDGGDLFVAGYGRAPTDHAEAARRQRVDLGGLRSLTQPAPGGDVDFDVHDRHDGERDEEGAERRVDDVARVAPDQWRRADDEREDPHARNQRQHPLEGALLGVVDRIGDGPVAVERDRAQVEDGRGAAEHVRREPHLAHVNAKLPAAEQRVGDVQRQHKDGDGQVGHRQRHDEEVLHDAERPVGEHAQYHQDVAHDGDDDDEREDERRPDCFPLRHGQLDADHARNNPVDASDRGDAVQGITIR